MCMYINMRYLLAVLVYIVFYGAELYRVTTEVN